MQRAFIGLTALAALVMVTLPVIPGHDVPQHLAYVRLLADFRHNPATYPLAYAPPETSSGYATIYVVLAKLTGLLGTPELALRFLLLTYVVALSVAVHRLVRGQATALLGPLAAFNPVFCMGLIAYLVALPPLVGCVAAVAEGSLVVAAALAALTGALHSVAAAALVFFVAVDALRRRRFRAFAVVAMSAWLGMRLAGGNAKLPTGIGATLMANIRGYGVIDGTLGTFRISFTHWSEKLDQIAAAIVGPFPHAWKLIAGAALVVAIGSGSPDKRRGLRIPCAALGLAAILAPVAIQVPDDLSLLDFRLITTAVILGIAAIPPARIAFPRLVVAVTALLALWARQLRGAAAEIGETVQLVADLGPDARVLALSMHDTSAYFDDRNSILHYAAVYHTVRSGGVTSQFWARFSPRLPVGYRAEFEPSRPPDWAPWLVTDTQLASYTHVVVRWPEADDEPEARALATRIHEWEAHGDVTLLTTAGSCALFAIAKAPRLSASFVTP